MTVGANCSGWPSAKAVQGERRREIGHIEQLYHLVNSRENERVRVSAKESRVGEDENVSPSVLLWAEIFSSRRISADGRSIGQLEYVPSRRWTRVGQSRLLQSESEFGEGETRQQQMLRTLG